MILAISLTEFGCTTRKHLRGWSKSDFLFLFALVEEVWRIGRLNNDVHIHGGWSGRKRLRNFYKLDEKSRLWTEIHELSSPTGLNGHLLSAVSPTQLLLIRGS